MIVLEKISTFELRNLVEIAYKGDSELLDKYWGTDFNLEDAVNETMSLIRELENEVPMTHYAVIEDEEEIGYISCFEHNLYSFGININYRTKRLLIEFWEEIEDVMGKSFICMLYVKNTRAINWLKTCGMKIVPGFKQEFVTLLNI